jgi:F0F1-type ATP synthase membrane subunit b/b'
MINRALAEFSDPLEELGETVGDIASVFAGIGVVATSFNRLVSRGLLEPLRVLGQAFEWLYNNAIYPAGNGIISAMNGVIGALNKLPFVNIKKLEYLEKIGEEAEDMAREMERHKERITALYERQKDRVEDELSAQMDSLRAQYELGLISRAQYTAQAEACGKDADEKLIAINEEMKKILEGIEDNTYAALTEDQKKTADTTAEITSAADPIIANSLDPATTGIVSAVTDAAKGNWADAGLNLVTGGLYGGIKRLFGFDTGTPYVPHDMTAVVHRGEAVIPRTFNEGIRRGGYSLAGGRGTASAGSGGGGTAVYVTVTVQGSAIQQDGPAAEIYGGIAKGIASGRLAPLPA